MNKLIITSAIITGTALAALAAAPATPAPAAAAPDAKAIWSEQCAKCHGDDGKGETKMGKKLDIKDLTDAKIQASFTDEQATKAIKEGTKDKTGEQLMKPIEGIKDDEIKALIPYVRALSKK